MFDYKAFNNNHGFFLLTKDFDLILIQRIYSLNNN